MKKEIFLRIEELEEKGELSEITRVILHHLHTFKDVFQLVSSYLRSAS